MRFLSPITLMLLVLAFGCRGPTIDDDTRGAYERSGVEIPMVDRGPWLPEGRVAFVLPAEPVTIDGDTVIPGDIVDVLKIETFEIGGTDHQFTLTWVAWVCVLEVGQAQESHGQQMIGTTTIEIREEVAKRLGFQLTYGEPDPCIRLRRSDALSGLGLFQRSRRDGHDPDVIKWYDGGMLPEQEPPLIPLFE